MPWIHGWVNNGEAGLFETPSCSLWRQYNVIPFQPVSKSEVHVFDVTKEENMEEKKE